MAQWIRDSILQPLFGSNWDTTTFTVITIIGILLIAAVIILAVQYSRVSSENADLQQDVAAKSLMYNGIRDKYRALSDEVTRYKAESLTQVEENKKLVAEVDLLKNELTYSKKALADAEAELELIKKSEAISNDVITTNEEVAEKTTTAAAPKKKKSTSTKRKTTKKEVVAEEVKENA